MALQLTPTTKEHPGTAQLITKDIETGKITEREWSGLITPSEKADMLTRAEELARAVKQARQRANDVVLPEAKPFAERFLGYVFTGATK